MSWIPEVRCATVCLDLSSLVVLIDIDLALDPDSTLAWLITWTADDEDIGKSCTRNSTTVYNSYLWISVESSFLYRVKLIACCYDTFYADTDCWLLRCVLYKLADTACCYDTFYAGTACCYDVFHTNLLTPPAVTMYEWYWLPRFNVIQFAKVGVVLAATLRCDSVRLEKLSLEEVYHNLREGRVEPRLEKKTSVHPTGIKIPDLPVFCSLAYCEWNALDYAATGVGPSAVETNQTAQLGSHSLELETSCANIREEDDDNDEADLKEWRTKRRSKSAVTSSPLMVAFVCIAAVVVTVALPWLLVR
uniref:Uncharacterized protein n=1 Tax=Timema tahoe TaxID=61484 RepID=A0A7R9ISI9_9NEOP|nr:unnamed protein product [Timema tahoe]